MPSLVPTQKQTTANIGRVLVKDDDLNLFLYGALPEPEDRASRRGVHGSQPSAERWKSIKPKLVQLARINIRAKKFKYTEIHGDQIRLLRIRPAKPTAKVQCDICVKSLAEVKGMYEALSYCWGMEEPTEAIYIYRLKPQASGLDHELLDEEEFPVRPNLLQALRHLRREDKGVIIWIDAICINQRESPAATAEKNRQLSMMSEIYNSAKNVCIWLGSASPSSSAGLKLVNDITSFQILDERLSVTGKADDDQRTARHWCDLIRMLKDAPWFSRRWIIQEIASARHASIHCGEVVVHWDDLADAISLLLENQEILKRQFEKFDTENLLAEVPTLSAVQLVKALTNVCRKTSTGEIVERLLDLETLVCTFQRFHARYPQDIIHSVRALAMDAPDEEEDALSMGLKKSIRDLFVAFVKRCIHRSGSFDIICRHWAPPVTDSTGEAIELPSWISDLSNAPFGISGEYKERQNGENFVALSSNDRRRRYNASLDWGRHDPKTRPGLSIPMDVGPLTGKEHLLPGTNFTASPSASPALEKGDPFPLFRQERQDPDTVGLKLNTITESESMKDGENPPFDSEAHSPKNNHQPTTTTITIKNPDGIETHPTSHHRRSHSTSVPGMTDKSKPPVPKSRRAHELLDVLADAARFPGQFRKPTVRRASRSRQDGWFEMFDKEHVQNTSGSLPVRGFVLGVIKECSDIMRDGIVPGDWLRKLRWDRKSHQNRVPDILWRTLVADRNPEGGNPPGWYQRACLHCLNDPRLTNTRGDLNTHKVHKVSESMTSMYLKRVESVVWRRRIIEVDPTESKSKELLYGLAPEKTQVNDIICILVGCSVPVVLRRRNLSVPHNSFELIGEAYIHGKMDGEAVQNRPRSGPQETFLLE